MRSDLIITKGTYYVLGRPGEDPTEVLNDRDVTFLDSRTDPFNRSLIVLYPCEALRYHGPTPYH